MFFINFYNRYFLGECSDFLEKVNKILKIENLYSYLYFWGKGQN